MGFLWFSFPMDFQSAFFVGEIPVTGCVLIFLGRLALMQSKLHDMSALVKADQGQGGKDGELIVILSQLYNVSEQVIG